jgi:hypothetical protein
MVTHLTELIRPIMDTETMDAVRGWSKDIGRDQWETNGNVGIKFVHNAPCLLGSVVHNMVIPYGAGRLVASVEAGGLAWPGLHCCLLFIGSFTTAQSRWPIGDGKIGDAARVLRRVC